MQAPCASRRGKLGEEGGIMQGQRVRDRFAHNTCWRIAQAPPSLKARTLAQPCPAWKDSGETASDPRARSFLGQPQSLIPRSTTSFSFYSLYLAPVLSVGFISKCPVTSNKSRSLTELMDREWGIPDMQNKLETLTLHLLLTLLQPLVLYQVPSSSFSFGHTEHSSNV